MTPAEIRDLADAVEAETALDGQVALALGWICERPRTRTRHGLWRGPCDPQSAYHSKDPPSFTTSLDALAAECARRDVLYTVATQYGIPERPPFYADAVPRSLVMAVDPSEAFANTPAAALCAALLRAVAVEKEAACDCHLSQNDRQDNG